VEGLDKVSRGLPPTPATHVIIQCFSAKRHPIKRCAVGRHALAKAGAMMFFSFLSSNNFSRLGVSHFNPHNSHPHPPPLGERQKLITFPITAGQSHILIFNTPPSGVTFTQPAHGQQEKEATTRQWLQLLSYRHRRQIESRLPRKKKYTDSNFSPTLASTEEGKKNDNRGKQSQSRARALWLELPSLRRACPSFQNLSLCAIVTSNS